MNTLAIIDSPTVSPEDKAAAEKAAVDLPQIEPSMANVLGLAQRNNSTVTPREVSAHLERVLANYDELTTRYAQNTYRIDEELRKLRQESGVVSSQLHQLGADVHKQDGRLTILSASSYIDIQSVRREAQLTAADTKAQLGTQFAQINSRVSEDVIRLDQSICVLDRLLQAQADILREQSARLDQFGVTYQLLDTATRGNRQRIEAVRDEATNQHTVLAAQVAGLHALQREHYEEFTTARRLVNVLQTESRRLDQSVQLVAARLDSHVDDTRRGFKRTQLAIAVTLLLPLAALALIKWAPAFAPVTTENRIAQTSEQLADVQEQLAALPALAARSADQDERLNRLTGAVGTLGSSISELRRALREVNTRAATAQAPSAEALLLGPDWLTQQPADAYTIQLLGTHDPAEVSDLLRQQGSLLGKGPLFLLETRPDGRTRYNLFYGQFGSARAARAAASLLPAKIQDQRPWVRRLASVQRAVN